MKPRGYKAKHTLGPDGLGIQPGKIKHVWLIIMENKSYDATFSGLNDNTYLWKTLPSEGVLLTQYYGTGHFSNDNYLALVSGQATVTDTQSDCPYYDAMSGTVDMSGNLTNNPNYGQFESAAGPNAAAGQNGCVYPATVPTLFNQLDAAGVSWKGYAQDLNDTNTLTGTSSTLPSNSAGTQYCGAPYATPGPTASTSQPNPGSANPTDQYVPKHFPFPWFESVLQSGDCDSTHIANLFDPSTGLYHDLQSLATTPAFSWITPDNCSDAHDAVCAGNNLSGGWANPTTPNPPVNYTGGLYAGDLFLEHIIPEIESSPAFKQGGLIDITFDEAFPPFTYTGNSFQNATDVPPDAATSIADDTAGETLYGKSVNWEPQGPNTPLATAPNGQELYPGDGDNAYIDRPSNCVEQTVPPQPAGVCILGGANTYGSGSSFSTTPVARTDTASAPSGADMIADNSVVSTDEGRSVTGAGIPSAAYVGHVTDTFVNAVEPKLSGGFVDTGEFMLVNSTGQPIATTGPVTSVTLGPETAGNDPLYDADDATNGGGDTGSVLISPYIKPGTVSNVYYNHYSWLRTMEDLFDVKKASPGLDGMGHLGYAAQPGLAPFGPDVFNNPSGRHAGHEQHALASIFALTGLASGGAVPISRRRRRGAKQGK
ncbi:MAG TPA: alkaline phosphatase family protein [Acidimicrobiales bacterium]|nr:alkaline phosphatase family protein [Acidimicrobiales bacterium]